MIVLHHLTAHARLGIFLKFLLYYTSYDEVLLSYIKKVLFDLYFRNIHKNVDKHAKKKVKQTNDSLSKYRKYKKRII